MRAIIADGNPVKVDDEDYDVLAAYVWHLKKRTESLFYVYRYEKRPAGCSSVSKFRRVLMHRQVMGFPESGEVDHIDGDPTNNQKSNLRLVTHKQNSRNMRKRNGKYKGVLKCPLIHGKYTSNRPWRARIRVDGKLISLGYFPTREDAARAYNEAALANFGEYASVNDIPQMEKTA